MSHHNLVRWYCLIKLKISQIVFLKSQMEIVKSRSQINKMENSLEEFTNRLELAQEKIREPEDR